LYRQKEFMLLDVIQLSDTTQFGFTFVGKLLCKYNKLKHPNKKGYLSSSEKILISSSFSFQEFSENFISENPNCLITITHCWKKHGKWKCKVVFSKT
jgi:hypothetical protein